jgi:hypothetical protein
MQFPWTAKCVALYRHYDAAGRLLYVGISNHPIRRAQQHRINSKWVRESVRMTTEWLPDAVSAALAELEVIKNEKPLHNKPPNAGPQSHRTEPTVMINARVPETLMQDARGTCKKNGVTLSDFVRDALEAALKQ